MPTYLYHPFSMFQFLKKPFASSSTANYPKGSGDFEQYFKDEMKPLLMEQYSKYPQAPKYVLSRDAFVQGYIRCPVKYRECLLDTLQRKLMAVDDGTPLPWDAHHIPKMKGVGKVMVSIPRTIEKGWKIIHTDYSYDNSSGRGGIDVILFDSLASPNCSPQYICKGSTTSDFVLGEDEALRAALKETWLFRARKVWCISECEALVDYINGSRQVPKVHMPIVL